MHRTLQAHSKSTHALLEILFPQECVARTNFAVGQASAFLSTNDAIHGKTAWTGRTKRIALRSSAIFHQPSSARQVNVFLLFTSAMVLSSVLTAVTSWAAPKCDIPHVFLFSTAR